MKRNIPLVISEGSPFERGLHLGQSQRSRVRQTLRSYRNIFAFKAGRTPADARARAAQIVPAISAYAPELLEEMRGIAMGADCDVLDIVAINARTELMHTAATRPECTAIGVTTPASVDGHVRLAQNWDWHPSQAGALVLWLIRKEQGQAVLTLTEAGMVGKIGVNSAGLGLCINFLASYSDNEEAAPPMHVILRKLLDETHTVAEAVELLAATPRSTSCNHLLADRSGALADVEATPMGQSVHTSESGILTHTNHCTTPSLFAEDRYVRENPETLARGKRAETLAHQQPLDEAAIRALLADHEHAPDSICLHTQHNQPSEEQGESVASIIFDLTGWTLDIADGPPCRCDYRRVQLKDWLALSVVSQ